MIDPASPNLGLGAPAGAGGLGGSSPAASRDQFLRLFVAQLQNQNPLDPQSGADMVAQLAQFSSLEQAVATNHRLAELIAAQDAAGSAGLADLVGRQVTATASTIEVDGPLPALQISAAEPLGGGEVVIRSASGAEVRRIAFGPGASPLTVPGSADPPLPPGTYTVEVVATGRGGTSINARPELVGVVDAVELTAHGPRLRIAGARISPATVTTIARSPGEP